MIVHKLQTINEHKLTNKRGYLSSRMVSNMPGHPQRWRPSCQAVLSQSISTAEREVHSDKRREPLYTVGPLPEKTALQQTDKQWFFPAPKAEK